MTEEERQKLLVDTILHWIPMRWGTGNGTVMVVGWAVYGDVDAGGIYVYASRDDGEAVEVDFPNADCYGEVAIGSQAAKARVEAIP